MMTSLGPFDLTGGPFLLLYGSLLLVTIPAGFIIPRRLRPEGRPQPITDPDQLACLAGGRIRFVDTIVTRLLSAGALVLAGKNDFQTVQRGEGLGAAERDVLALPAPVRWKAIERTLKPHAIPVEHKLVAAGLLMDHAATEHVRFRQTLPYLLLLGFGIVKWVVGTMRDRPTGYLTLFLIVTAVFALIRWAKVDRRTHGGLAVLERARARAERLRRAPTAAETGQAVALFGTVVLAGSALADFHQLRSAGGSDGGGSSSGCGGGGGGGGGCGGCGT
jgi:uncharacterized protein (TIGR04222 family)